MSKRIDVYGLTPEEIHQLKHLAEIHYGKPSISLFAKKLLKAQLSNSPPPPLEQYPTPTSKRITIRLPEKDRVFLQETAKQHHCSINELIRDILQSHIHQKTFYSKRELDTLYQSNYQLLRIGRNLNQLVKTLYSGGTASVTLQEIQSLHQFIQQHADEVKNVLLLNRDNIPKE